MRVITLLSAYDEDGDEAILPVCTCAYDTMAGSTVIKRSFLEGRGQYVWLLPRSRYCIQQVTTTTTDLLTPVITALVTSQAVKNAGDLHCGHMNGLEMNI